MSAFSYINIQNIYEKTLSLSKDDGKALCAVMEQIKRDNDAIYWAGIYLLSDQVLYLGPYAGPKTEHLEIPVGRGVCGTAVAVGKNQNISDVSSVENYLACNLETKSELVVLVYHPSDQKTILGQIDIDATKLSSFDADDEKTLETVAALIAPSVLRLNDARIAKF